MADEPRKLALHKPWLFKKTPPPPDYSITVRGVTLQLPERQMLQPTRRGMRWKFRSTHRDRESGALFSGDDEVTHNGATIIMFVTDEEIRAIRIADLRRERDTESRITINANERIRQIDIELDGLGYEGSPEA